MTKGRTRALRALKSGRTFEQELLPLLRAQFSDVKEKVRLTGFSGNKYIADFVVEGSVVVEASSSFRVQQKVTSTLCKFVDLDKNNTEVFGTEDSMSHPPMRYALVMKYLPQESNQNRPIYRQMNAFGYRMFHPTQMEKLKEFVNPTELYKASAYGVHGVDLP